MTLSKYSAKCLELVLVSTNFEITMLSTLKFTSATKRELLKICRLKHRLRIFLFHGKIMFRSQDIQVFVF